MPASGATSNRPTVRTCGGLGSRSSFNANDASARGPLRVLALSGGGANGAFAAGVLTGLTEAGARPEFQIVTGVSAGALAAPFAFLGPRFDQPLRELFTEAWIGGEFAAPWTSWYDRAYARALFEHGRTQAVRRTVWDAVPPGL